MPSQHLSLVQSQQMQMVLAPQLRQSLEMLQMPMLELQAMVREEIEQNPTIEETPIEKESVEIEPKAGEEAPPEETDHMDFDKQYEALARLDDDQRDYFYQNNSSYSYNPEAAEKRQFLMDSLQQTESLQEHLLNQLNLAGLSEHDRQIGELLLGSLNEDGYLTSTLEDIAASASFEVEQVETVLHVVQDFHPTGIGAKDLRECLLLQLARADKTDTIAADIVRGYLTKLGSKKYPDIARALKITVEEVQAAAKEISRLDPKPGRIYSSDVATYIMAEVVVEKVDGVYQIILNDDQLPHLRINNYYRGLMSSASTKNEVKSYIRERIKSGAFLIKSIHQRQKTIHKIASEIVDSQMEFLEHGVSHLKPLTMAEVADKVGVHETTVSRAVNGKYMKTPLGLFELKYFFTPGIKMADGSQVSNMTVKDILAALVAAEDDSKPLSDQELVEQLKEKGINIARRTVAKYRLVLRIPPSHMRKGF
jgi:RNA polymerase sigma-54 factor